jgi:1-phosphofructokinase
MVTVTIESATDGRTEIHFHAGGQGYWVARMVAALGEPVVLCVPLGGEAGEVYRALTGAEGVALAVVDAAASTAAYVHDRRSGDRTEIAQAPAPVADRHELDELHNAVIAHAVEGGVCVLAGHPEPTEAWVEEYRRLAADLRRLGVEVVADLRGDLLDAVVENVTTLKVSADELGLEEQSVADVAREAEALQRRGAGNVVVTRADEPTVARYGPATYVVEPPRLEVVDSRGGGDAATAALTIALRRALDADGALRLSAAAGATSVARRGLGSANPEAVENLMGHVDVRPLEAAVAGEGPPGG